MSKKEKCTLIGGQALIEGVMMRGKSSMAMAVRDEDGVIRKETKRLKPADKSHWFFRLPIVRGCKAFVSSMLGGIETLMRSAEVYGEEEPSKFESWLSKTFKVDLIKVIMALSLIIAMGLAVLLFIALPQLSRQGLELLFATKFNTLVTNLLEGLIKIIIFLLYIVVCALVPDVKRTFMYHGAEHKTISCYEEGLELTPENAKKCTRIHDRCGTTFMVFVLTISILVFALLEVLFETIGFNYGGFVRILLKILVLPLIAGLSYELLRALAKTKSKWVLPFKVPGMLLQKITTKEPDEDMLEVAITAFNLVLEMDADESIPTQEFVMQKKAKDLTESVISTLKDGGIEDVSDAEWIVALSSKLSRDEVYSDKIVKAIYIDKINEIVKERLTGKPLWYCIGDTEFFDYKIKVDENVLIPRPETEQLVEEALKSVNDNSKVLDLCTGSGAIAIAVSKKANVKVMASDVSDGALSIARENARINGADVEFIKSDMFTDIPQEKFDVIISNPPYIKSEDINTLDKVVKDFEPILALDGGEDGLKFYRFISQNLNKYLADDGVLYLEIGFDQADDIRNIFSDGFNVEIIKDYSENDRIAKVTFKHE